MLTHKRRARRQYWRGERDLYNMQATLRAAYAPETRALILNHVAVILEGQAANHDAAFGQDWYPNEPTEGLRMSAVTSKRHEATLYRLLADVESCINTNYRYRPTAGEDTAAVGEDYTRRERDAVADLEHLLPGVATQHAAQLLAGGSTHPWAKVDNRRRAYRHTSLEPVAAAILDRMAETPDLGTRMRMLGELAAAVAPIVGAQAAEALWCLPAPGHTGPQTDEERVRWMDERGIRAARFTFGWTAFAVAFLRCAVGLSPRGCGTRIPWYQLNPVLVGVPVLAGYLYGLRYLPDAMPAPHGSPGWLVGLFGGVVVGLIVMWLAGRLSRNACFHCDGCGACSTTEGIAPTRRAKTIDQRLRPVQQPPVVSPDTWQQPSSGRLPSGEVVNGFARRDVPGADPLFPPLIVGGRITVDSHPFDPMSLDRSR
jgi:hypothetical protein